MADEKKTKKTDETAEETPAAEEKPKRTRATKAEPEAAAPEAEAKPKRTRKKAEETAAEPAEAPAVEEEVEAEAEQVEAEPESTPEPVAEEAPADEPEPTPEEPAVAETVAEAEPEPDVEAEAAAAEEPVAAEPLSEEPVAEEAPGAEPATDEGATEQPSPEEIAAQGPSQSIRGPKPKKKRLPRAQRHKHSRPKRESTGERKPITRLPKPESERGRDQQRRGVVVSAAMDKTIVVRVDSIKAHPKYKKVIRRSKKFHAHDEQNQAKAGDVVRIVETRPLSKTKRWRLAEVLEVAK
jgi:small subunit ribosomal protein S17